MGERLGYPGRWIEGGNEVEQMAAGRFDKMRLDLSATAVAVLEELEAQAGAGCFAANVKFLYQTSISVCRSPGASQNTGRPVHSKDGSLTYHAAPGGQRISL